MRIQFSHPARTSHSVPATDMTGQAISPRHPLAARFGREARLTWFMVADNLLLCTLPPLLFALAASLYAQAGPFQTLLGILKATVLSLMFLYVFDSSNQVRAGEEDARNKPYRPIAAGLTDARGLTRRFWCAMPVYTLTAWLLGGLAWVLLWQVTVLFMLYWASPQYYSWWKTPSVISGAFTQLGTGWQVVAPLDPTAWRWILTISLFMPLACVYEDIRDMPGDRAVGRRTPAIMWGARAVRLWFVALTLALPAVCFVLLIEPAHASLLRTSASVTLLCLLSWTCAARAIRRTDSTADRITYQLFTLTWAAVLATASLLWSP